MGIFQLSCISTLSVLSRSTLNLIDRHTFKKGDHFFLLHAITTLLPLIIGYLGFAFFELSDLFNTYLFSLDCFLISLATHLVSICYCSSFRYFEVKKVLIQSKIPEIIFPFLLLLPFFEAGKLHALLPENYLTMLIGWIGLIPIFMKEEKFKETLTHKSTIALIGVLLLQMTISTICSRKVDQKFLDIYVFTVATLTWRGIFVCLPLIYQIFVKKIEIIQLNEFLNPMYLIRALVALITQFTFIWCIIKNQPLVVWPILNTTPLISMILSRIFLREELYLRDIFAICCFFVSSLITFII